MEDGGGEGDLAPHVSAGVVAGVDCDATVDSSIAVVGGGYGGGRGTNWGLGARFEDDGTT